MAPVPGLGILRAGPRSNLGSGRGLTTKARCDTGCLNLAACFPWCLVWSLSAPCLPRCRIHALRAAGQHLLCSLLWGPSLQATTWLRVATSPQVGVSCTPLEGGGHRLALPHSKAGRECLGPTLAVGGPLADVAETVSNPPTPTLDQKALVSAHTDQGADS